VIGDLEQHVLREPAGSVLSMLQRQAHSLQPAGGADAAVQRAVHRCQPKVHAQRARRMPAGEVDRCAPGLVVAQQVALERDRMEVVVDGRRLEHEAHLALREAIAELVILEPVPAEALAEPAQIEQRVARQRGIARHELPPGE
jgi:hypothetical protein